MKTNHLILLLQGAAVCHIGLVWAGATMPKVVGLLDHLRPLPTFVRRLVLVYLTFLCLVLLGFGTLTLVYAREMAEGAPVARGLCALMLVFWVARLVVAAVVFDVRPYLTTPLLRIGYQATNVVFVYLVAVYALVLGRGWLS